jgi:hypothetical protein
VVAVSTAARRGAYPLPIQQPKQKYSARKTTVDDITFASKMEAAFYEHLKRLQAAGEVDHFVLQPSFTLQCGFKKHGKTVRPITYVADFGVVFANGRRVVYDVKGMPTPVWKLKAKLYARLYDEPLIAVTKTRNGWREW